MKLTDDVIAAVERGLEFEKQLKLSPKVSFSIVHITQVLAVPTYFVRPFKHIRCNMVHCFVNLRYVFLHFVARHLDNQSKMKE